MHQFPLMSRRCASALALCAAAVAGCDQGTTGPATISGAVPVLTAGQVASLDSAAQVIVLANPGNPQVTALVDSTLLVLTAGVQMTALNISTNLTPPPRDFVGIHRVFAHTGGSFATWTLVGFDDPANLTSIVEVSGFAQSAANTPPPTVNGTIGDGTGIVNALMLHINAGGSVTQWNASSGTVSFSSDASTGPCPGFVPTGVVTCAVEAMIVHFTASATSGSGGATARQATIAADVVVPAMRLTYAVP